MEKLAPAYAQVPETIKKVIRIREKYPFLRSQFDDGIRQASNSAGPVMGRPLRVTPV